MSALSYPYQDPDLIKRALRAYFRYPDGAIIDQPSSSGMTVVDVGARRYVTLENGSRLLACYRLRSSGLLSRVTRIPSAIRNAL